MLTMIESLMKSPPCNDYTMQGGKIKAETGQQLPRQRPDGNRRSDDGKPRDSVRDTVGNMAAVAPARKCVDGQQVFDDF